jgi:heme/copper-type cytochrome/quinol oxidase subunit 2
MNILDAVAYLAFAIALVMLPVLTVNWSIYIWKLIKKYGPEPRISTASMPIKSVLAFIIPVVIVICASIFSQSIATDEVLQKISSLPEDCDVFVNGQRVQDPQAIISTLKSLHAVLPHHSEPTRAIKIEIRDHSRQMVLILGRDSGDPREYWVFYPKHAITARNEIGRITTSIFDTY